MTGASISRLAVRRLAHVTDADIEALAALMIDVVEGGASIGFMLPIDAARAAAFWRRIADGVEGGERALFVADDGKAASSARFSSSSSSRRTSRTAPTSRR